MMRQVVTTDANGKTVWRWVDHGPQRCIAHIPHRVATQNGIPVRVNTHRARGPVER